MDTFILEPRAKILQNTFIIEQVEKKHSNGRHRNVVMLFLMFIYEHA